MPTRRQMLTLLLALPALKLAGCDSREDAAADGCSPIVLNDEHECALCGMTVVRHPGPKGQACLRDGNILAFCSVQDLLSWAWQPESAPHIRMLYVHDLSRTGWDEPVDDVWMDASQAVYVVGHDLKGAMGHPPAPFSAEADAEDFASRHGGRLLAFDELDWETFRGNGGDHAM